MTQAIHRPIHQIAREIAADWQGIGKGISPYARPYLSAMLSLDNIGDKYGLDSADSVIRYFLSNAASYRGENAKRLKAELKQIIGMK